MYTEWRFDVLLEHNTDKYKDPTGMFICAPDHPQHCFGRVISAERVGQDGWRAQCAIIEGIDVSNHPLCTKEWLKRPGDPGGVAHLCALLRASLDKQTRPQLCMGLCFSMRNKPEGYTFRLTSYITENEGEVVAVHIPRIVTHERVVELMSP